MAGARLGRPKKGGAKDIDVKDVDGLPALLQKEVPYHEPNRSPHGGTALSAYPPARLLQPQQSLSTARSLIWQVAMRRPGASAEYQYCLVLERADANLNHALTHERFAAGEWPLVRKIATDLVHALDHLHAHVRCRTSRANDRSVVARACAHSPPCYGEP